MEYFFDFEKMIQTKLAMTAIDFMGWAGSILFAICGLPQAIHSYRNKHSDGLTWSFILMWLFGEIFTFIYVYPKNDVLPLLTNYAFNFLFLSVILWYKAFPQKQLIELRNGVTS